MQTEHKIIADHLRSSCFLIADGVLPSNEGRGYVLRRILRRAMRQLHKLGVEKVTMYKFLPALIKQMGESHPELIRAEKLISETLKNEEEQFRKTLDKGLKILKDEIKNAKTTLDGEIAFKLYDTYGFPLDLTQDILREHGLNVDLEAFDTAMQAQKQRAKANWKGSGEEALDKTFLKLSDELAATKFLGYQQNESEAIVLATGKNWLVLDQTPFYATSGGQKGDQGTICGQNGEAQITTTEKFGAIFVHFTKEPHNFNKNDQISAKIDQENRQKLAKNHSATHLMHKALKITLGEAISQKGSNVDAEQFTFDFNFNRSLTQKELKNVEELVNSYICQNSATKISETSLENARKQGAEALFGEKYADQVRVVAIGGSIELCGGTHVTKSNEIEFFKIISEKSIASGIRRITAKTSLAAKNFVISQFLDLQKIFDDNVEKINLMCYTRVVHSKKPSKIKDLAFSNQDFEAKTVENAIQNLTQEIAKQEIEIKKLTKELNQQKKQKLLQNLDDLKVEKIAEINLITHIFDEINAKDLQEITNSLRQKHADSSILLVFGAQNDKIAVCLSISQNLVAKFDASVLIKEVVTKIGGKGGGGKKDLAFGGGTDKNGIATAIAQLKNQIAQ